MAKDVHVDPEHVRRFATDLQIFRERVTELTAQLQGNLGKLSESWRDEAFERFAHAFMAAKERLHNFSKEVEQTLPKLHRDAERAEEYQNEQMPDF